MTGLCNLYYKLLNFLLKIAVRSRSIPADLIDELGIEPSRPIIYALPYDSKTDLLTVRRECLQNDLPDPLEPFVIDDIELPRYVFIENGPKLLSMKTTKLKSIKVFHDYLDLHKNNPNLDVQLVPVSIMFGRAPGKEKHHPLKLKPLNGIQKFFSIIWLGRDCFVRFSKSVSLRYMADEHGTDNIIAQKLMRVARMHFSRLRMATIGPKLPKRQDLFNHLLMSKALQKAIEEEANSKKISYEKAEQNAKSMMEEIAANFTYDMLRLTERVLTWTWNRLYQGLNIHNAERIRKLAQDGHEIVYAPCHRSHMDYLLLSYVLYHQGLVPPHIAAGINLDFWPAGPIFRRLGAFFIRRSFKGNKLYATVFREYLSELFNRGYSVEYFVEGGRSRTGRLLEPKTGTLSMTIQAMLRGISRPIMIVPVYIGYEHVMEVSTYAKELRGAEKEKESLLNALRAIRKLHNLGMGYVNFGEPISLTNYLNSQVPNWRDDIDPFEAPRPAWLTPTVNKLAHTLMVKINNAAAANAINLCSTALLASRQRALTREQLIEQLECYLAILNNVRYSDDITIPQETAEQLLSHALKMDKFEVEKDTAGEIIILPRGQAVLMTYYRNNIQHLLILPSLIADIVMYNSFISRLMICEQISKIYPLIQAELFIHYEAENLTEIVNLTIDELLRQGLVLEDNQQHIYQNNKRFRQLQLLAAGVKEILKRYTITLSLLRNNPQISRSALEKESRLVAQRLSVLHGINAPEFFDKAVFATLVATLKKQGYTNDDGTGIPENINDMYQIVSQLISPEVRMTIESVTTE